MQKKKQTLLAAQLQHFLDLSRNASLKSHFVYLLVYPESVD